MKYVIDLNIKENDCSFCPCFARPDYSYAECNLAERRLESRLDTVKDSKNYVRCYDRPDWCPLVSFEVAMAREWVESVNSQPSKDEPKEIIRVELYESEVDKLGGLAMANKLNTAQMIAKLIDDCKVAKPYVNHGDHGPEPRFEGDAWTMWYCCGNCDHPISPYDNYCKTCGAKIDWSDCV